MSVNNTRPICESADDSTGVVNEKYCMLGIALDVVSR